MAVISGEEEKRRLVSEFPKHDNFGFWILIQFRII